MYWRMLELIEIVLYNLIICISIFSLIYFVCYIYINEFNNDVMLFVICYYSYLYMNLIDLYIQMLSIRLMYMYYYSDLYMYFVNLYIQMLLLY